MWFFSFFFLYSNDIRPVMLSILCQLSIWAAGLMILQSRSCVKSCRLIAYLEKVNTVKFFNFSHQSRFIRRNHITELEYNQLFFAFSKTLLLKRKIQEFVYCYGQNLCECVFTIYASKNFGRSKKIVLIHLVSVFQMPHETTFYRLKILFM